jgi:HEPN domain-containing protein
MSEAPASLSAWLAKADNDLAAADALSQAADPLWDIVVFHAQQAVEKFLKALLVRNGQRPPKIHDLRKLLSLCCRFEPQLNIFADDCEFLSPLAAISRYPGPELASPEADGARGLAVARSVRVAVREAVFRSSPPTHE